MKDVAYSRSALRTLRRIPRNEAERIRSKIEQYAANPAAQANNVKKLQGREGYRLRVGDWRVIFDENHVVIDVLAIGPRGGVYDQEPGMIKPDIITTPGGERMAVIPLAHYRRLVADSETAHDLNAYDAAKARLASGADEIVPAAFARRLLDGENPVAVYRGLRGLTARALAAKVGVSAPYLSQIEAGKREGSIAVMKALAEALGVGIEDLV